MAAIDALIAETFGDDASFSLTRAMTDLDLGIMRAGKMAELIRNEALHPIYDTPDEEAIAALCTSLIAYLGFLGASVDEVERRVSAGRIVTITPVSGV